MLKIDNLHVRVAGKDILKGLSLEVKAGEVHAIMGPNGAGKSTLGYVLAGREGYEVTQGSVMFNGQDLLQVPRSQWQPFRRRIQIVFQNPYASLNPRFTIGQTLLEPMRIHGLGGGTDAQREERARYLLGKVGLDAGAMHKYPHEFSGGQRQRIAIARALVTRPRLIVADEPVSALDVSVQAQVLNLMQDLQQEFGITYMLISHDLAVVHHLCDDVAVLWQGKIVEQGPTDDIFDNPRDVYTQTLMAAAIDQTRFRQTAA